MCDKFGIKRSDGLDCLRLFSSSTSIAIPKNLNDVVAPLNGTWPVGMLPVAQVPYPTPDLSRRKFWGELSHPLDRSMSACGTILHPDEKDVVCRLQPAKGFVFLFPLAIEAILHEQISLEVVGFDSCVHTPNWPLGG